MFFSVNVSAHPGNVSSDGAHYCRTNCAAYGYTYGERICHYPSQGCGQENIRQDSYESGSSTPSLAEQGNTNGTSQAQVKNNDYIKSNATTEGTTDGNANGNGGSTDGQTSSSATFCSQPLKFDIPQDQAYVDAFQSSYASACTPIYDTAYSAAYNTAYTSAQNSKQGSTNTTTDSTNNKPNFNGWFVAGGLAAAYGVGALVVNRVAVGKWFRDNTQGW